MNRLSVVGTFVMLAATFAQADDSPNSKGTFYPELQTYLDQRVGEFDQIPAERKTLLKQLGEYVYKTQKKGEPVRLTFICTHNSRRSHMSQLAAAVASRYYRIDGVEAFSGGTEATAFNPRAVAAVRRAGFQIDEVEESRNPRFPVRYNAKDDALVCFSKVYADPSNPQEKYCAVMTCSQADKSCPVVIGSSLRLPIPYDDPKVSDGTPEEAKTYDARLAHITREMLYAFSTIER